MAVGLMVALFATIVAAPSAYAATATAECTLFLSVSRSCTTGTISASANNPGEASWFVNVRAFEAKPPNPVCDASDIKWQLIDANNGQIVGFGYGDTTTRINGLYGRYYGRLFNTCSRMSIFINTNPRL
ncbi:hypothetical protein [Streptosporangium subroseum]|uniref:hypothetical protein n=1 Tax=Streptosporangium subroseum TaxID=106412 RepID=UPI000B778200|nr:hypothetical protein [Streptosporangium subroseum]